VAELKSKGLEWSYEVEFAPGEVADMLKEYTSRLVYRPVLFAFTVRLWDGESAPKFNGGTVSDPRVLKDKLGDSVSEHVYSAGTVGRRFPWLMPYITEALERTAKDVAFDAAQS
jgi:hypothetical protein